MSGSSIEPRAELSEISAGVARLFSERLGRGPRKTRAMWADGDVLVVLLETDLTRAEATLRDGGRLDEAVATRRVVQELLEPQLVEIVEGATRRSVVTVLHAVRVEPELSSAIFVLGNSTHFPQVRP